MIKLRVASTHRSSLIRRAEEEAVSLIEITVKQYESLAFYSAVAQW
ncbi:hypothetical protein [Anoxybacillus mongoliensis]|nr:hypothetical protein [Anoxybacillus mongoliensis]MCX8002565.1 hypothetical protein [Anoxybacillus mongoliensis]